VTLSGHWGLRPCTTVNGCEGRNRQPVARAMRGRQLGKSSNLPCPDASLSCMPVQGLKVVRCDCWLGCTHGRAGICSFCSSGVLAQPKAGRSSESVPAQLPGERTRPPMDASFPLAGPGSLQPWHLHLPGRLLVPNFWCVGLKGIVGKLARVCLPFVVAHTAKPQIFGSANQARPPRMPVPIMQLLKISKCTGQLLYVLSVAISPFE